MKRFFLFAVFSAFILCQGISIYAQGIKLGIGGGLTLVQGPDGYKNDINDGGAGFSNEYHYGIKAKLSVPLVPITPYGHITNHKFSGNASNIMGEFETSQSILSIGIGAELTMVPGPVSPYFAFEIASNSFGDFELKAPLLEGGNHTEKGESRFGAAIGVGTEITILPLVNFDVSAKYNWFNLVGKQDDEETVSAVTLNVLILFSLL